MYKLLISLIGLAFLGMGCAWAPRLASTKADITGRIVQIIQPWKQGTRGSILVDVEVKRPEGTFTDKYVVTIKDDTAIFRREGDKQLKAAAEDLAVGQEVQVWFVGPVRESFPMQVDARQVVIAR